MKRRGIRDERKRRKLSVPSTSGLRDETVVGGWLANPQAVFQYPQPRVYAMKPSPAT